MGTGDVMGLMRSKMRVHGAIPWGVPAIMAGAVGYLLEAIRQRGTCEFGDASPDTLVISVLLIVFGAGLGGMVATVVAVVGMWRHGWRKRWLHLACGIVALVSIGPVFLFAGAGPSTWFQYCAT